MSLAQATEEKYMMYGTPRRRQQFDHAGQIVFLSSLFSFAPSSGGRFMIEDPK